MLKYPYLIAWLLLFAILISTTTSFIPVSFVGSSFIRDHHDITTNILLMADDDSATEISDTSSAINHQRNIIVLCHNVSQDTADGIFDVNNLLKGRIDVLTRCITSSLWRSNNIRSDTTVYLLLFPHNITVQVRGSCMRSLTPDERTTALYLQRTLWRDSYSDNTTLKTPQKRNTTNQQSTQMSDEKKIRMEVKGRNKLIDRIRTAHKRKKPLQGFILHRNDTLQARLEQIVNEDDEHTVYMLSETGDLLWDVLEENTKLTAKTNNGQGRSRRTTTLILGNQNGYSADDESLLLQSPIVQEVSLGALSLLTSQCITITHHYLDRYIGGVG